ncbi:MAG: hypothetical protein QXD40_04665 [Desulfurococcaceae archaeon]
MELNLAWLTAWEGFWFYILLIFLILFYGGIRRAKKGPLGSTSQSG